MKKIDQYTYRVAWSEEDGKFVVRVPPQLHRQLATQAAESGASLNRLVAHKLARDN